MSDEKNNPSYQSDAEQQLFPGSDTYGSSTRSRQEPRFSGFEEEDEYEEPDRDTDFAAIYDEDEALDEYDDRDEPEEEPPGAGISVTETKSFWDVVDDTPRQEWDEDTDEETLAEDDQDTGIAPATMSWDRRPTELDQDEAHPWREQDDFGDEDEGPLRQWSLGMIVVGVVALLLLAAGGYGVVQQRSAMEEEIRQLQATLATSATPEEVASSRAAIEQVERRNTELQSALDELLVENKRLKDTVAGLEAELQAQKEALARPEPAPAPPPTPEAPEPPPAKPKPAEPTPQPKPATTSGSISGWFVNFGSYSKRETAEAWTGRLKPATGKVAITTGARDGRTFYRVRVVGLSSRDEAESVARSLEQDYDLTKLWVGQQ